MKRWKHSLLLPALGVLGFVGSLIALHLRGAEHWLLVLTIGAMIISGPGIFMAGLISLLGTQTFLRKARALVHFCAGHGYWRRTFTHLCGYTRGVSASLCFAHLSIRLALVEVWKRKLVDFSLLPLCARGIVRQFLEKQPLIRAQGPQRELRGTVARLDHMRIGHFGVVFVVLVPHGGV
jgi:hypothetical protein